MRAAARSPARWFVSLRGAWWAIVAFIVVACGREEARAPDSSSAVSPAVAAPAATRVDSVPTTSTSTSQAAPSAPTCLSEGAWQSCSIEKRLTDAGFIPIKKGPAPDGIFPVAGTTYALGTAELHVYIFSSAKAREQAIAVIDTTTVSRRGAPAQTWAVPPTLVVSNNLAAVLISDNARQVERVQNAIRAGLPAATR